MAPHLRLFIGETSAYSHTSLKSMGLLPGRSPRLITILTPAVVALWPYLPPIILSKRGAQGSFLVSKFTQDY